MKTQRARNLRRRLWNAQGGLCALCKEPIDLDIPARDPLTGKGNRMAPTLDHKIPVSLGGRPSAANNFTLTHDQCNQRRGNGMRARDNKEWAVYPEDHP
jgi:5-methylcytosine-specific restriction endonuclease McrA